MSWLQFDEGRPARADAPAGERADPFRFGRIEGWKARYRRPGSASTQGPLVVESRADLFEDTDGARADLEASEAELERPGGGVSDELATPALGDEAHAFSSPPAPRGQVRYLVVVWRYRNVTATLAVKAFRAASSRRMRSVWLDDSKLASCAQRAPDRRSFADAVKR